MNREKFQNRRLWLFVAAFIGLKCWIGFTTGLGDDEAYYWQWSKHLALNYYDHPPMTAWLIAVSTWLFGDNEFAVRLPSMVAGFFAILFIFKIASALFDQRVGRWSVALFCLIPIYSLGSILMVPDVPMLCLWLAMLLILKDLIFFRELGTGQWVMLGMLGGLGLLTKFTMILLPGSVFVYLLLHRRNELKRPAPWMAIIIMILFFAPVLLWNANHDWASFQFHFSDRHSSQGADWGRYLQFIGTQMAFLSPFIFLIAIFSLIPLYLFGKQKGYFIFWMSFPTLLLFGVQPLFSEFKPHWTAPGFLMLLPVVASVFAVVRSNFLLRYSQWLITGLTYSFLIAINLIFFIQTKFPIAHQIHTALNPQIKWQPKWDPTNDLYGGAELATMVNKYRAESAAATGKPPFLAASRYQLAAPLAFYTGHEVWAMSNRHDQYDYWKKPELKQRDAIVVADNRYDEHPQKNMLFSQCEEKPELKVYRRNIVARIFKIWLCTDYQGEANQTK